MNSNSKKKVFSTECQKNAFSNPHNNTIPFDILCSVVQNGFVFYSFVLFLSGLQRLQRQDDKHCNDSPLDVTSLSDDLVDATLSDAVKEDLKSWQSHDESRNDFCDVHSETCEDCDYIDLTINPERFTGYSGEPSRRVW